MLKKTFQVPQNLGEKYVALLRSVIIESTPIVKPFAFSLGDHSTPYKPAENIRSLATLGDHLASYSYVFSKEVAFPLVLTYSFKGSLRSIDLNKPELKVVCPDESILECFDSSKENILTLVFLEGSGIHYSEENKHLLNGLVSNPSDFRVMTTRMTDVKVATSVKKLLGHDEVTLEITSQNHLEEQRFQSAVNQILEVFEKLSE